MIRGDGRGEEVDEGRKSDEGWQKEYPPLGSEEDEASEESGDEYREYSIEREDGWECEERSHRFA